MPARPSATKFDCLCEECIREGGPNGKIFPLSQRVPHLKRVKALRDAANTRLQVPPPTTHALGTLVVSSFAASGSPLPVNPSPPSSNPEAVNTAKVSKREKDHRTVKVHRILDVVERRSRECLDKLASPDFSLAHITNLEQEISRLQESFDNVKRNVPSVNERKAIVKRSLALLQGNFAEFSAANFTPNDQPVFYNSGMFFFAHCVHFPLTFCLSDHHFNLPIDNHNAIAQVTMLIAVICNVMMGVSRRLGDLVVGLLVVMLTWSLYGRSGQLDAHQKFVVDQIPSTLDTILKKFNLDGTTVAYATCPDCHCTYAPKFLPGSDKPMYPEVCNNHPDPDTTCTTKLLDTLPDGRFQPIRIFNYPVFDDYVAALLSHRVLEGHIDNSCDTLIKSIDRDDPPPNFVSDGFNGEFVRTFKGPDGKRLFVDRPEGEARLLFVINVDYFSAEGQTIRGASASCGILSAACLNLPLDIRYKPENMYILIIPGPKEPSKTELNHYIRPVVDNFLASWQRGVFFSRTARHANGRLARWAMAAAVNDLPAARQFSQCASHSSHHFCSRCSCFGRDKLGRVDVTDTDWNPKDVEDLRSKAEAWRAAPTRKLQGDLFSKNGLRWTELWRLPYWDPPRMLVVDPMHCLLEGLAQYHFRVVLGLSETAANAAVEVTPPFQYKFSLPDQDEIDNLMKGKNDVKHIPHIHALLLSPLGEEGSDDDSDELLTLNKRLLQKNLAPLRYVMESLGIKPDAHPSRPDQPIKYSKKQCADALTAWVRTHVSPTSI